jgi:hypothetical protein
MVSGAAAVHGLEGRCGQTPPFITMADGEITMATMSGRRRDGRDGHVSDGSRPSTRGDLVQQRHASANLPRAGPGVEEMRPTADGLDTACLGLP